MSQYECLVDQVVNPILAVVMVKTQRPFFGERACCDDRVGVRPAATQLAGEPTGALSLGMSKSIVWTWISRPGSDSLTKTYRESPLAS